MAENDFQQRFQPLRTIQSERGEMSFDGANFGECFSPAAPTYEQPESVRGWQDRMRPKVLRAFSAGQLLFQIVGVAGYAGYFASMHTLMRVLSGSLMAGAWYMVYIIKGSRQS